MPESPPPQHSGNDGSYVVVARRYRPRGFGELVGQEHVGRALTNAIETNRVGHAYLFTGARGVGKTSTARIFAKALNDPSGPTATPDNTSDIALAIDSGEDVDVIEIDGASNRGIDEIRSLRANVGVRPSRARFKIYIIDEVHMLTPAAFNALLKTLEEPPEHVKFIFCTTDPEKIPITVLSRCQRFDFAPVEVSKIVTRLREIVRAEAVQADDDALEMIARRAAGSMRDSQSLLEQVLSFSDGELTVDRVHAMLGTADDDRLHGLAQAMAMRDSAEALRQLDVAIDAGVDAGRLAEQLLGYFRDLMAITVGCEPTLLRHTSVAMSDQLKELGERWGLQTVLAVVGLIDQTLVRIRHSVYARVLLEATLIQICSLPDLQCIADLAAAADSVTASASPAAQKKKPPLSGPPTENTVAGHEPGTPAIAEMGPVVQPQHRDGPQLDRSDSTADVIAHADTESPVTSAVAVMTPPAAARQAGRSDAPWDQATARQVWQQALGSLESMTESFARVVEKVRASGDHGLCLIFPADASLARKRCELPEHQTALTHAVSAIAGKPITLEFASAAPSDKPQPEPVQPVKARPSRLQRMREIESNALVKSCVELFDAEIVRIDKPK